MSALLAAVSVIGAGVAHADSTGALRGVASGRCLDVTGRSQADGALMQVWDCNGGTNQQWTLTALNQLTVYGTKCLDVPGHATAAGTRVQIWSCNGGTNQQWRVNADGTVTGVESGLCLDVSGGGASANSTPVVLWTCNGQSNQQWTGLTPTGPGGGNLPSSFRWTDQGPLISAKPVSGHNIVSVKDPSIVRYNGQWLVYATTADTSGAWSVEYTHFTDFSQAASASQYHLSDNPNLGHRYMAAPQVFYFAPQNKWYLVFQQGPPAFSTNTDPTQPQNWSTPTNFFASTPPVVDQHGGGWLDFFVTCDTANCYLFYANDAGDIFRSQTTVANFPNGFGNTAVVLHDDNRGNLFEATAVYKVKGSSTYLMLVEGWDSVGHRVYRAWTAPSLSGSWTQIANPFAGLANVTFPSGQWTNDVSHGELIRTGYDQTMEIDPCHLQLLYQGVNPNSTNVPYSQLPYQLGLLTQTNPC
ncbi:alpha-N-arabinofuranosidase [Amycolatopsis mediterranei S699]|uniref:non-reducing end alpha-L-arabinofuranosidase n=1 Tax=Amycolatopsis mediterranei (strain S699) TaxID=713604 RepID=A0A9R0P5C5_AMYMS|nr:alpha-N-arabinofuranosidase [Amycolatopsis mediterranei S699]